MAEQLLAAQASNEKTKKAITPNREELYRVATSAFIFNPIRFETGNTDNFALFYPN